MNKIKITSGDQAQRMIYAGDIKEGTLIYCTDGIFEVTAINECAERKSDCWATLKEVFSVFDDRHGTFDHLSEEEYFWTCYDFVGKEVNWDI